MWLVWVFTVLLERCSSSWMRGVDRPRAISLSTSVSRRDSFPTRARRAQVASKPDWSEPSAFCSCMKMGAPSISVNTNRYVTTMPMPISTERMPSRSGNTGAIAW